MPKRLLPSLLVFLRSRAFKTIVGLVVLAAVGRHVVQVWRQIPPGRYDLGARPWTYAGSTLTYLAGLSAFGVFYGRILHRAGRAIPYRQAIRAYLISHLGKYVPGKAFVVVIRAGLSTGGQASAATAAFATLYETLLMMAVGGLIAAPGFLASGVDRVYALMAFCMGLGFLATVSPGVFPRIGRLVKVPFRHVGVEEIPGVSWPLVLEGLLSATLGWVLLGASLAWILLGLDPDAIAPADGPAIVAGVAFATVGGFVVAVLPGGLGVREGLLIVTLTPVVGDQLATISALLLRLIWVLGEVLAAAVLLPLRRSPTPDLPCSASSSPS